MAEINTKLTCIGCKHKAQKIEELYKRIVQQEELLRRMAESADRLEKERQRPYLRRVK